MSGREFGVQSAWHDIFRKLMPDADARTLRQSSAMADSISQQIEEFVNRYVATFTNDNGDFTFDATGTFIFNGNVEIAGDLTLDGGVFQTNDTGQRVEITDTEMSFMTEPTGDWYGLRFYTGDADEFSPGVLGVSDEISLTLGGGLVLKPPTSKDSGDSSERDSPYILLRGDATDGNPAGSINLTNGVVYVDGTGGSRLEVNGPAVVDGLYFNDNSADESIIINDGQSSDHHLDISINNTDHLLFMQPRDVTLSFTQGATTLGISAQASRWFRIGDLIFVDIHVVFSGAPGGTSGNNIAIEDLPVDIDVNTRFSGGVWFQDTGTANYFCRPLSDGVALDHIELIPHNDLDQGGDSRAIGRLGQSEAVTVTDRLDGMIIYMAS